MIFQQTHQQVLDGTKTQTRKPVKPGDVGTGHRWKDGKWLEITHIHSAKGYLKWAVNDGDPRYGYTYAVQPGRGKKAVGRIRITKIRQERLQEINSEDMIAEGFLNVFVFARIWDSLYRKPYRWEDDPEVWVLEFELLSVPGPC